MPQSDAVRHPRPDGMFDRAAEWKALVAFACAPQQGPAVGVISGRRRQGKTYLLKALTSATGGFYFGAQEVTEAESLRQLADQLALHTGASPALGPHGWVDAVDALLALGEPGPLPVVIDEFPDLVRQSPALPPSFMVPSAACRPGVGHPKPTISTAAEITTPTSATPMADRPLCTVTPQPRSRPPLPSRG
ncbi:hypothetical protein OHA61_37225 [Streptomyces sp. NBC_00885]|uniref:hypothetical protein n=1 Tax=Streptomyces sp. NBC_00885 TaxID=2975857 RepID=UPI003865F6A2|nr:hypothetical protein OHA61_37225 [Streptomyces sp. NBC_00885]